MFQCIDIPSVSILSYKCVGLCVGSILSVGFSVGAFDGFVGAFDGLFVKVGLSVGALD